MFIDIATGFLAPAFADWISRYATSLPKGISSLSAQMAVDAQRALANKDAMKASLVGATKFIGTEVQNHATTLFGEGAEDQLLDGFKRGFQSDAVTLSGQIPHMSDDELLATWVAYSPERANVTTYKVAIDRLLRHFWAVQDLGAFGAGQGPKMHERHGWETRAYWIDAYGKSNRMIILQVDQWLWETNYYFVAWVPEIFQDQAKRRTESQLPRRDENRPR